MIVVLSTQGWCPAVLLLLQFHALEGCSISYSGTSSRYRTAPTEEGSKVTTEHCREVTSAAGCLTVLDCRCLARTFRTEFFSEVSSVLAQTRPKRCYLILEVLSMLSGPTFGNTSASTGGVLSPSVKAKRMRPNLFFRGDSSALLSLRAPGGTGVNGLFFSAGCVFKNSADMMCKARRLLSQPSNRTEGGCVRGQEYELVWMMRLSRRDIVDTCLTRTHGTLRIVWNNATKVVCMIEVRKQW